MGQASFLGVLRAGRGLLGLLVIHVLVLNLLLAGPIGIHNAKADAFETLVANSRCLDGDTQIEPRQQPAGPSKQQPCPTCAIACSVGSCSSPAMWGGQIHFDGRLDVAGLDACGPTEAQQAMQAKYRSQARAQAPPVASDSFLPSVKEGVA